MASLSLANLLYVRHWTLLRADAERRSGFWLSSPPGWHEIGTLLLNIIVLTALFFALLRAIRSSDLLSKGWRRLLRIVVTVTIVGVFYIGLINAISLLSNLSWGSQWRLVRIGLFTVGVSTCFISLFAYFTNSKRWLRFLFALLLIVSPLAVISAATAISQAFRANAQDFHNLPTLPAIGHPPTDGHLLWLLFDEWDEELSFGPQRAVDLPALDRIRNEAFYSDNVTKPGFDTDIAIPALTIGKRVDAVMPYSANRLLLRVDGHKDWVRWGDQPNIFASAHTLGFNTEIVGWGLPYCRILANSTTICYQLHDSDVRDGEPLMVQQIRALFETELRSPFGQTYDSEQHGRLYHQFLALAKREIIGRAYNLIFVHMPVPHAPFFFNQRTGRDDYNSTPLVSFFRPPLQGYIDTLALVDRTVADIRGSMEAAGLWDSTTILITADHSFRKRPGLDGKPVGQRVPFILKLAGQSRGFKSSLQFSALLTHDLLLALLENEISSADELERWVLQHQHQFRAN